MYLLAGIEHWIRRKDDVLKPSLVVLHIETQLSSLCQAPFCSVKCTCDPLLVHPGSRNCLRKTAQCPGFMWLQRKTATKSCCFCYCAANTPLCSQPCLTSFVTSSFDWLVTGPNCLPFRDPLPNFAHSSKRPSEFFVHAPGKTPFRWIG